MTRLILNRSKILCQSFTAAKTEELLCSQVRKKLVSGVIRVCGQQGAAQCSSPAAAQFVAQMLIYGFNL